MVRAGKRLATMPWELHLWGVILKVVGSCNYVSVGAQRPLTPHVLIPDKTRQLDKPPQQITLGGLFLVCTVIWGAHFLSLRD